MYLLNDFLMENVTKELQVCYTFFIIQQSEEIDKIPISVWQSKANKHKLYIAKLEDGNYLIQRFSYPNKSHRLYLFYKGTQLFLRSRSYEALMLYRDYYSFVTNTEPRIAACLKSRSTHVNAFSHFPDDTVLLTVKATDLPLPVAVSKFYGDVKYKVFVQATSESKRPRSRNVVESEVIDSIIKLQRMLGLEAVPFPNDLKNAIVEARLAANPTIHKSAEDEYIEI